MSKEQTPINLKILSQNISNNGDDFTAEQIESYFKQYANAKVLEALEPIIQECKKVIDSPNHLESTKGFASIIWYELEQSKQK